MKLLLLAAVVFCSCKNPRLITSPLVDQSNDTLTFANGKVYVIEDTVEHKKRINVKRIKKQRVQPTRF